MPTDTFESAMMNIVEEATKTYCNENDFLNDLLNDFDIVKDSSFEHMIDDFETRLLIQGVITSSIKYMVLNRCDINPSHYIDDFDFHDISYFNTPEVLAYLGTAITDISKKLLIEIGTIIKEENQHENHISTKRELSNSTLDIRERNGGTTKHNREIWNNAIGISSETPENKIYVSENRNETLEASGRNRPTSKSDIRNSHKANDGTTGDNGRIETSRPNEMDSNDEQHQSTSRRSDTNRTYLQPQIDLNINTTNRKVEDNSSTFLLDFNGGLLEDIPITKEIPSLTIAPQNFIIQNDKLGYGSLKEKAQANIIAIQTLKQIENENRHATFIEQEILSHYVGWGGIPQIFDENKLDWTDAYTSLKELLSPDEYAMAQASTLNAHYTSPIITQVMYEAIQQMNLPPDLNVIDPAMGIGNFFGTIPNTMEVNLYGVELDSISGRIAKQLYPNANIEINKFEKTNFSDNKMDLAIGNVPFGDYTVNDEKYNQNKFMIHDYFFAKTLDKIKVGGIIAFITSKGTLDKINTTFRNFLSQSADLLGAIRLPIGNIIQFVYK